jgi:glutamyl-tRNA reductase
VIERLVLLGLSHHTAPLTVRERLSRLGDDLDGTLSSMKQLPGVAEGMVLATCNRVELYGAGIPPDRAAASLRDFVRSQGLDLDASASGLRPSAGEAGVLRLDASASGFRPSAGEAGVLRSPDSAYLYERQGTEAVRHLFRVASSLDSMVIGEPQILGQLKDAFQAANAAGATGDYLHRTVGRAFAVAKRVRTETDVGRNAVSMSYAAVELARRIFASLEGKQLLLIGAGEMATLAARHLAAQKLGGLAIANRSPERAQELARELATTGVPCTAHGLDELPELLGRVDIVLSAAAPGPDGVPLVSRAMVAKAVKARRFRPLFLVDLAVPRSIAADAADLANVYVKDVDDIGAAVKQNTERRLSEASRAEAIIELEVTELARMLRGRSAVPVLADLRRVGDGVAEAEAHRTLQHLGAALDDKQREHVRAMAHAIVNKLLHEPTTRLRRAAELGVEAELADATARLFGFSDERPEEAEAAPAPGDVPPREGH